MNPIDSPVPDRETYRLYWQVQYERVAQHENGRYQVSAYVLAGSLVALGVVSQGEPVVWVRWVAALGVALINLLTVIFIRGERRWVKVHQDRAKVALRALAPELVDEQGEVNQASGFAADSSGRNAPLRSSNVLASMHVIVAVATVLVALTADLESPHEVRPWEQPTRIEHPR